MKISKRAFMRLLVLGGTLIPGLTVSSARATAQIIAESTPRLFGRPRILQGPMLGTVTSMSILLWLRVSDDYDVTVEYSKSPDFRQSQRTRSVRARAEDDYTANVMVDGVEAATRYYYRILLDGTSPAYTADLASNTFTTGPEAGVPARFTVGTGSCARYAEDPYQLVWHAVDAHDPDFFVWLGDNVYGDTQRPDVLAEEYQRQREVVSYVPIAPRIPQLAIWDDHDFGVNDGDRTNPSKIESLRVFKNYWANPSYGLAEAPGVFFQYQYGSVDFFFLDVRYYRDPNAEPDHAGKTMLGSQQKSWLKAGLKASDAPFKILLSGSGWCQGKGDSWSSFMFERNELLDFIRDENIGGVVLVSGDTHVAELNAIPWSDEGGYDFYDLATSPLAQGTSETWLERRPEVRIRQVYFGSTNFGLLTFDMRSDDPVLEYNVVNCFGETVWEPFSVRASELVNGMATWQHKMDEISRARYESARGGGEYYEPKPSFES